jgi:MoaE-MoaD fusion protein
MQVSVKLFAGLRERAGAHELELQLPDGASVGDALAELAALTEGLCVVMAVNEEYAEPDLLLSGGDELALIPPVSGGSVGAVHAALRAEPLSLDRLIEAVRDPRAGAIVTFAGVTRDVPELQYEAYASMAERQLAEIVAAAIERHGLCAAATEHRVGIVPLSEPSVLVAASAPHRAEAFAGAREIIDAIKAQAPIWKKEAGEWVQGATPGRKP